MTYLQRKKRAFMSIVNNVKGFVRNVVGIPPLTLSNCVDGDSVIGYKIYGESTQNGVPTPYNPIEIMSVGDLVTDETNVNYGKYKIPVKVIGENGKNIITNIYLDKPLRKIGHYADYIDFENKKVIRNFKRISLTPSYAWRTVAAWNTENTYYFDCVNQITDIKEAAAGDMPNALCNMFSATNNNVWGKSDNTVNKFSVNSGNKQFRCRVSADIATTVTEFKSFIKNNNISLIYQMETPTEEDVDLLALPTFRGTTIYEVDTSIQPSNMEITYYSTQKGE